MAKCLQTFRTAARVCNRLSRICGVGGLGDLDTFLRRGRTYVNLECFCRGFSTSVVEYNQARQQNSFQVCKDALANFAKKINWSLSSNELLLNALTHKSYVMSDNEKTQGTLFNHNESVVYLGYPTASSFVTEILNFKYPMLTDERLLDLQNGLLREDLLDKCGRELGLHDLIISKDEISGQIVAEALLAIISSIYLYQPLGVFREFIEKHVIPELTDEMMKEICQLEHPKFMLKQVNPGVTLNAKVLEKHSIKNLYGEETVKYIVGIFEQDETVSQGQGDSLSTAEKNACQNLLKEKYLDKLKKSKFPLDYEDYMSEDQIHLGLLPEGIRVVELTKGESGFGFSLKGGEIKCEENRDYVKYHYYYPPFVSSLVEGGPADGCGLKAGDVILAINRKSTKGMGHHKVVTLLESLKGKTKFIVKNDKKVLIRDEIERKFNRFKERKMLSQLSDPTWSKWHYSNVKNNRLEYDTLIRKRKDLYLKDAKH